MLLSLALGCSRDGAQSGGPEVINGIVVPPAPDPIANQATVAGIDSNADGVRDDVERFIATEFGAVPAEHAEAITYARTQQAAITVTTPERVAAHVALVDCITDHDKLLRLRKITFATTDIGARRAAYGLAFAGVTLSGKGCTP